MKTFAVILSVSVLTACGTTAPNPHLDPCYQAVKCITQSGQTQYLDPSATQEYGGSGSAQRYQSPQTLTIYNTQGRRVGTIR